MATRKIQQSPIYQGIDERIAYTLTTTPWASSPSSPAVVLKDQSGSDISASKLSGTASVAGDVITTPLVISLVKDHEYRLEIKWVSGGNTFESWAEIVGEE